MIQLYLRADCPFCTKVLRAADAINAVKGVDYEVVDAAQGTPGRQVVLDIGGKAMVPFLVDGEISMYESDDIIAYMRQKLAA